MLIFKIILWVILAVLGIILLLLLLPVSVRLSYIDKKFSYSVNYSFFRIFGSDGEGMISRFRHRKKNKNSENKNTEDKDLSIINISDPTRLGMK